MCFHWMTKQLHRPSDTPMLLMVLLSHVHLYAGYACVCVNDDGNKINFTLITCLLYMNL